MRKVHAPSQRSIACSLVELIIRITDRSAYTQVRSRRKVPAKRNCTFGLQLGKAEYHHNCQSNSEEMLLFKPHKSQKLTNMYTHTHGTCFTHSCVCFVHAPMQTAEQVSQRQKKASCSANLNTSCVLESWSDLRRRRGS